MPSPTGRPPALDETKRQELLRLLAAGCSLSGAARILQCSPRTIRRAASRDSDFRETLHRAQLTSQIAPIRALRKAAKTHWRAAAWLLERSGKNSFVPQKPGVFLPDDVQDLLSGFIQTINELVPDPQLAQLIMQSLETYLSKKSEQLLAEDYEVRCRRAAQRRRDQTRRRARDVDLDDPEDDFDEDPLDEEMTDDLLDDDAPEEQSDPVAPPFVGPMATAPAPSVSSAQSAPRAAKTGHNAPNSVTAQTTSDHDSPTNITAPLDKTPTFDRAHWDPRKTCQNSHST